MVKRTGCSSTGARWVSSQVAVADFFPAVDVRDVRVIQGREGLRFASEPNQPVQSVRKQVRESLERDITIQLRIWPRARGEPARLPECGHAGER